MEILPQIELNPVITSDKKICYEFKIPKIYMKSISLKNFRLQYSDFEYYLNQYPIYYDAKYLIFKQMQKTFSINKIEFVIGGVIILEFNSRIIEYILSTENEVNLTQQWISCFPNQNGIYHDFTVNIYYNNNYYRNKPILICNGIEHRRLLNPKVSKFHIPYIRPNIWDDDSIKQTCNFLLLTNNITKRCYDKYIDKENIYPFPITISLLVVRRDTISFW